jgi:hypothetical protein
MMGSMPLSRDRAAAAFSVVIRNGERRVLSDFAKIRYRALW